MAGFPIYPADCDRWRLQFPNCAMAAYKESQQNKCRQSNLSIQEAFSSDLPFFGNVALGSHISFPIDQMPA